ncbi:sugar transferase [Candidatus Falkowbacteria bacterium CG10_big_fil_rev_8_21_14_0_10_37_6]|uniref:Sugar transferase n=1 Tax=Candidatus Falkowbacteria bacterium CG10_big_fil_rev_8_21_14_0_10_37_6 TaxID=1974563 RepID=A0A2H0V6M5_9BACT|nr:MAG: sugar transferase [Candidatus Falkowbacteria bacterium CG10_big_fil_rev_8_21_14_0_10_37_6]
MNNKKLQLKKYLLLGGDIVILYLSLYLALSLRYGQLPSPELWHVHLWPFTAIFIVWIIIFYISNLYDLTLATNNAKFYALTAQALVVNFLLGAAFFYLNPQIGIAPKTNLLLTIAATAFLFMCWRQMYNILLKSYLPKNNIAIIGANEQALELIRHFHEYPHLGFTIACIIDDQNFHEKGFYNIPIYNNINDLRTIFKDCKISLVILAEDLQKSQDIRTQLFSTLDLGINFMSIYHFYEKVMGKIPVKSLNQMWFLENLNEGGKLWYDKLKRSYDLLLAFFILIITIIFWPIIGLIIKMESNGKIFYIQNRLGKNNKIIKLYKFRTMREEGNTRRPTVSNDARVTRFGKFLRKTRLDELPQILNIIKGDMTFIGPRPERPELAEHLQLEIPFYNERTLVLPGVTGWDQVCGEYHSPSVEDTVKKLQYDLFYIKNRSVFLDLIIILRTVRTVLMRGGV